MPKYQPVRRQQRQQSKKLDPKDLTFETKKTQARALDKKKLLYHIIFGFVIASTVIGLAIPLSQQLNLTKPKPVKTDISLADTLAKAKERIEPTTSSSQESMRADRSTRRSERQTEEASTELTDKQKQIIEREVQARLEEATQKVVDDYNQKLKTVTESVQEANQTAAQYKAERDALTQKVAELENQLKATQPTQPTTNSTNTQETPPQEAPSEPSRLVIPE